MYESYFGLTGQPFSLLPDADFLFMSKRHKRAIHLLDYGTQTQASFVVITGEVGAGKTTIIRRYLKKVDHSVTVGVITNPGSHFVRLLEWVLAAFDIETKDESDIVLYHKFVDFLVDQYSKGKRTVLIIDEAQNLPVPILEELRMLSNVNNEKDQMLQTILVGQPELLETLRRPELRQFIQRISVHCHLDPLDVNETADYIRHRLSCVGGSTILFDDTAIAAIHFFTGGVPRLINLLCDQSLVYAYADDLRTINYRTVGEVASDSCSHGLSAFRETYKHYSDEELLVALQTTFNKLKAAKKTIVAA